ncbi:MAG: DUF6519 domain-containing protein [Candidatus Binataceae bacterium]
MGSDRARVSYDPKQHYRSVVMQQGRVTLEADWNEDETIAGEELRHETLEIVGPAGTPDDGYRVVQTNTVPNPPFDFTVGGGGPMGSGTMYVGGIRLTMDGPVQYTNQPDWLDHFADPDWVMPTSDKPAVNEFIYLFVREQEVSAVEDSALRDVALGGPDTAQRTRMIQRIVRLAVDSSDCAGGLAAAEKKKWAQKGLVFDPAAMRLNPQSTLKASFQTTPVPDPCEPEAVGGYLGADNQLIRVQIIGSNTLVWGFDDASFLYRVDIDKRGQTLTLQSQPVDAFHQPQANQAVEVLRSAAKLSNEGYIASATGDVQTLTAPYNPDTMQIALPTPLLPQYMDPHQTPQAFLRVWQQQLTFTPGAAIELGTTGLLVTLNTASNAPFHIGDYWLIAVRPSTPKQVYPESYLHDQRSPDGPRMWACPLAAIEWPNNILKVDDDCRKHFCNLVEACSEKSSGCCTVSISLGDLTETKTLQSIIESYANRGPVKICLGPGTYDLTKPLTLGKQHSNFTIEACPGGATLQAAAGSETAFTQGLITLCEAANVTLRGLTFALPLVPSTLGMGRVVFPIYLSVGLRPVDCPKFSVEDCTFVYFGSKLPGERPLVATGILASGDCIGLRLTGNRFDGVASTFNVPVGLQTGFALFPSSTLLPAAGTNAAISAKFLCSWLDDAVLCDNFFGSLTLPVLVYADFGLVKLESNTVRDSLNGFWFLSLTSIAATFNMANVNVDRANLVPAVQLHNALYYTLANPQFQIASAALRGFPLPANYDLTKALTITPGPAAATDISRVQDLFDRVLPAVVSPAVHPTPQTEPARTAAAERVPLSEDQLRLREHPLTNILPVPASAVSLNQSFSAIENQAFSAAPAPKSPVAMLISGNDVNAALPGALSGVGLLVLSLGANNQDAFNLAGNTFIITESSGYIPVDFIAGYFACAVTGNVILNEADSEIRWSLAVAAAQDAVTGNVLRGKLFAFPPPGLPAPLNIWDAFNSILA